MLSEYEAAKLQREMHDELEDETGALLKSAIGLLVIVMLALIGSALDLDLGRDSASGQPGTQAATERRL